MCVCVQVPSGPVFLSQVIRQRPDVSEICVCDRVILSQHVVLCVCCGKVVQVVVCFSTWAFNLGYCETK